ncbi:hypothetical protein O1W68_13425 [Rhodococcus sp. H36-A4]|uniref:hypothetical protein n=1 Tax=Rhodococcus sp. H36-A4 TaxID=3004353 RepID=UPI0022B0102C|nr:hypothetical protein [Rhodococcus sp. H36-A4]MCZ4078949.1 hypothetical protein [Rhodococcus sp. H36-A4]
MADSTENGTGPDETMAAIAVAKQTAGVAEWRERLLALWERVGAGGDPLHRCTIGHYLADVCDDAAEALTWDIRALDAADTLTDDRVKAHHASLNVAGFYPSLHLNLADNYRRLSSFAAATRHLDEAKRRLGVLSDDGYGRIVRDGIDHVTVALVAGSTERLPSH